MFARLLPLLLTGCATSWAITQAAGEPQLLDEDVHEVTVPQPGIDEHVTVSMPLAAEYEPAPTTPTTAAPPAPRLARPFALSCLTVQEARDRVYHQAFRYGSRWKKGTAIAFALESAAASLLLLTADRDHVDNYLLGGYAALDAAVAVPLFFLPRREIYRSDDVPVTTPIRRDCPDGLVLAVAGDSFPVDASGRIGEIGETALADWMKTGDGELAVELAGQRRDLRVGAAGRCTWRLTRGEPAGCRTGEPQQLATVTIPVAAGTLSHVAADAPAAGE
jgi:hypothetical protein